MSAQPTAGGLEPRRLGTLTVIVPCHNEREALPACHRELGAELAKLEIQSTMLFVDDGSTDGTRELLDQIAARDPRVGVIKLARNFGKEVAMSAGLDHADADAVVLIDADLQDPPALIAEFIRHYEAGWEVVYGVRRSRAGETWLKRATAAAFYRTIGRISRTPIPPDTGDFRLLGRRAVLALRSVRERNRFMKGLFGWVGFRQIGVLYDRAPRVAGTTKFNYWRLWNFALEGITSFSAAPLKVATYVGLFTSLAAFAWGAWVVFKTLVWGDPVAGYPSLMTVVLFLGGMQLMALGMIGEYLGRVYEETKQRPLYLLESVDLPARAAPAASTTDAQRPG
jgi:glycosyltransferase involved in cell wall biosynthesis